MIKLLLTSIHSENTASYFSFPVAIPLVLMVEGNQASLKIFCRVFPIQSCRCLRMIKYNKLS